ncbi:MAG: hypothetical protein M1812_004261 [Candelaria pacifica]|nr:MAG: hypothetical protein M1812_004261 [Candelaria pacifica]
MAVLDLLPQCVSGVYLIYHDDFKEWSFGKISALREAALAVEGGYRYYYMDPETYHWDLLDTDLRRRLDVRKYVSLSCERRLGIDAPSTSTQNQSDISVNDNNKSVLSKNGSLFSKNMAGVMTAEEVESQIDLGAMRIKLGSDIAHLNELVGWSDSDILDPKSIKCLFGEFAATMGPNATRQMVIDWNQ